MKFKDENDFRYNIIKDLRKQGIPIVSLGSGTFDAYVENIGLIELKKLGWNPKYRRAAIEFTKDQTEALKLLHKKPFVLIFGNNEKERYYLLRPEDVKFKLSTRMRWKTMWVTEDKIPVKSFDSYKEFIEACIEAFRK